jgi:hypothetical protein
MKPIAKTAVALSIVISGFSNSSKAMYEGWLLVEGGGLIADNAANAATRTVLMSATANQYAMEASRLANLGMHSEAALARWYSVQAHNGFVQRELAQIAARNAAYQAELAVIERAGVQATASQLGRAVVLRGAIAVGLGVTASLASAVILPGIAGYEIYQNNQNDPSWQQMMDEIFDFYNAPGFNDNADAFFNAFHNTFGGGIQRDTSQGGSCVVPSCAVRPDSDAVPASSTAVNADGSINHTARLAWAIANTNPQLAATRQQILQEAQAALGAALQPLIDALANSLGGSNTGDTDTSEDEDVVLTTSGGLNIVRGGNNIQIGGTESGVNGSMTVQGIGGISTTFQPPTGVDAAAAGLLPLLSTIYTEAQLALLKFDESLELEAWFTANSGEGENLTRSEFNRMASSLRNELVLEQMFASARNFIEAIRPRSATNRPGHQTGMSRSVAGHTFAGGYRFYESPGDNGRSRREEELIRIVQEMNARAELAHRRGAE